MISGNILKNCRKEGFKEQEIYNAYKVFFSTLVSEPRLKIINTLRDSKKNVSEIKAELKTDQSALSHDLSRLKECGFVRVETLGKFRNYSLNKKTIKPLMDIIDRHMSENCVHILKKMKGGKQK